MVNMKKKLKRGLGAVFVWMYGASATLALILILVGAFRFAACLITGTSPWFMEYLGMACLMIIGGLLWVIEYLIDTED